MCYETSASMRAYGYQRGRISSDLQSRKPSMTEVNLSWGPLLMDRLSSVHRASRVQLPQSIIDCDQVAKRAARMPGRLPFVSRYVGVFGFLACGAIIVVTASFLALNL